MKPIDFSKDFNTDEFAAIVKNEMEAPMKHYEKELSAIRTGRASTALVSDIMVNSYGSQMRLKELATLSSPEARLIIIQPWDKSIINEIEKALQASDIGITPQNDGEIIRLQLPMMSSERREELSKLLNAKTEECRVGIRNVRKEYHNQVREAEKKKEISEDFVKALNKDLQKVTDDMIKKAEQLHDKKLGELKF